MKEINIKVMNYELKFVDSSLLIKRDNKYIFTIPGLLLDKDNVGDVFREMVNGVVMSNAYIPAENLFSGEVLRFVCKAYSDISGKDTEDLMKEISKGLEVLKKEMVDLDKQRTEYLDELKSETSSEIFPYLPELIKKEMIVRHYESRYSELVQLMKVKK